MTKAKLHPVLSAAAKGELPVWAEVGKTRRRHLERVADLMGKWARRDGQSGAERRRWIALGFLHDALRDADPAALRGWLAEPWTELPDAVLHGPAAAERLRSEGVDDEHFLTAVAYHTFGHPAFDRAGRALFAADFLEPGRDPSDDWRAALRARMPGALDDVVREILVRRLRHLLKRGRPVRPETVELWNQSARGEAWARASEL